LVVNPLLGPALDGYTFMPGAQLLLGPRYALVRPEIRRVRVARAQEPPQPFRALIALGDDDPHGQTHAVAQCLLNVNRLARIDLLARPQHPGLDAPRELAAAQPDRIEVATEPGEVTSRMA